MTAFSFLLIGFAAGAYWPRWVAARWQQKRLRRLADESIYDL